MILSKLISALYGGFFSRICLILAAAATGSTVGGVLKDKERDVPGLNTAPAFSSDGKPAAPIYERVGRHV